jgi:hypothetical protein
MTLDDAIALISHPALRDHFAKPDARHHAPVTGQTARPTRWADLGCGSGLFTLALANFLSPGSTIDAIDLRPAISRQTTENNVTILPHAADFTRDEVSTSKVDGILMANSLHYVRDKPAFLDRIKNVPALLLVEYDTDRAVPRWVPYPLSFASASVLLPAAGWSRIQQLGTRPSSFGRSDLYAVLALTC